MRLLVYLIKLNGTLRRIRYPEVFRKLVALEVNINICTDYYQTAWTSNLKSQCKNDEAVYSICSKNLTKKGFS